MGCAKKILSTLARGAYRRPVTPDDMETLLSFYQAGRNQGGSFDAGIERALRLILSSPEFIFRFERDPATVAAGAAYRINDLELASRLSFFLWSSIPDDELLNLAVAREAQRSGHARAARCAACWPIHARRRSCTNFAAQWLYLRNLKTLRQTRTSFPISTTTCAKSLLTETEMFFDSIVNEDRNVLDLLDANYTFVNERLAQHYGIPDVYGPRFRRVTLDRRSHGVGCWGREAFLTVTSYATRTSPVLRGKWILDEYPGNACRPRLRRMFPR